MGRLLEVIAFLVFCNLVYTMPVWDNGMTLFSFDKSNRLLVIRLKCYHIFYSFSTSDTCNISNHSDMHNA